MTKKISAIVLVMTMMFSSIISVFAEETDSDHFASEYGENLLEYLQGEDGKRLILRTNYGYMSFVENFNSDVLSLYLLNMADLLIDSGAKPDKEKYMEVLINIIATYDLDNADDISKQKQLDNLKGIEDYAMDCAKMGANAVSVMAGTSPAITELENAISIAVDGMSVLIDNTDNWISALSNLETIVQDYSVHYEFLEIIEKNSNDNNLKEAASTLRKGMSKAMEIKLDTYSEISNENFENYKEFFFTEVFFDVVKQTVEYESDETLSFFVDSGDSIVSSIDVLGDSWELGTMIGTLVGNVVAGGENLINRVLEMMAIYDVSIILQDYLIDTQNEFLSNIGNEKEESYLNKYISFSQYLIGCRIRGEYCLYSIVANDAGLLNWFNKESAEEAKDWYDNKVEKIINIQNNLLKIKDTTMNESYVEVIESYIDSVPWKFPVIIQIDKINVDSELYSMYDLDTIGYTLKDIDNNGIDELLVGPTDNNGEIYTAFSLVDGDLVLLFMSWSRSRNYLLDSGNILNNGSGGASVSAWFNETISENNCDMVIQDGVIMDGIYAESIGAVDNALDYDPDKVWFKTTSSDYADYVSISAQKANDTIYNWEGSKVHIDYIPLSKYTNQNTETGLQVKTIKSNEKLSFSGVLTSESYEINSNNKCKVSILTLNTPIKCYLYDGNNYDGKQEYLIESIQVDLSNASNYYNENITISGDVIMAHTGHHRRDIVLMNSIVQ